METSAASGDGCRTALLEILEVLLTGETDERRILQAVCEKLLFARSYTLVFVAVREDLAVVRVAASAGDGAQAIAGAALGKVGTGDPVEECMLSMTPVRLDHGLGGVLSPGLPADLQRLPAALYPLELRGKSAGLIGVIDQRGRLREGGEHALLLSTAGHTGIALGMLRAFVAESTALADLRLTAAVFDNSLEGIIITDPEGAIEAVNPAVTRATGYTAEELLGQNPRMLQSGRQGKKFYKAMWKSLRCSGRWQGEIWNRRKNGEIYPEWLSISAIRGEHGEIEHYIGIFIDISRQKEAELRLDYLAHHDKLTGLPNRDFIHDSLRMAIAQARRYRRQIALLFIDLDHFKHVNDTYGHASGDELLQAVARRLRGCLRKEDTLSRMGGDEFTLLLQQVGSREEIRLIADRIVSSLKAPFEIAKHEVYIKASVGVSIYPDDGETPESLLKNSDAAMYHAKQDGRDCVRLFQPDMERYLSERVTVERDIHRALERGEFRLFYQPQFNLATGKVTGVEALLRWQRPELGLVLPSHFIPLLEETGLIIPVGEWVLRAACAQAKAWHEAGTVPLRVAVNLSALQIRKSKFCDLVANVLSETGLSPACLELELTEAIAMHHAETAVIMLQRLKGLGIYLSIDDFGTGFSSLSYLKRFPVDKLKIDKSFVAGIVHDPSDAAIVTAIIAMAHSIGLGVIAEGVETQEQLNFLKLHHCNEVQGFLLGRPMPAGEIDMILSGTPDERSRLSDGVHP
ncbi:MAG: EAL domain-containing protein [Pseudomonadota bacterium]